MIPIFGQITKHSPTELSITSSASQSSLPAAKSLQQGVSSFSVSTAFAQTDHLKPKDEKKPSKITVADSEYLEQAKSASELIFAFLLFGIVICWFGMILPKTIF